MSALDDIVAERRRQIEAEGWTPEHDDQHAHGQLASAAGCYVLHKSDATILWQDGTPLQWPWDKRWWKPGDRRRDLVKAGALILAELERLDRLSASSALNMER